MAFRNRRKYRLRKRRSGAPIMVRRVPGRLLRFKYLANKYKFKRFGVDCQITNTSVGVINLNTTAAGWAITAASNDVNGTYQFGGAMQFQLNQTLEHADFATLFDRYKISGVKVTILPLGTYSGSASVQNQNITNFPTIAIACDNDDASLPGNWNTVAVKQGARITKLNKAVSMYISSPKIAAAIYNGITTAYSQRTGYLDMAQTDVPHYGLKFWIRECPLPNPAASSITGANSLFRVVTKFYLAMKDPQ